MEPYYFFEGSHQSHADANRGFQGSRDLTQQLPPHSLGLADEIEAPRSKRSKVTQTKTQKWMLNGLPPKIKVGLVRRYFSQFIGDISVRFLDPGLCELSDSEEVSNQCVVEPLVGADLQVLSERIAGSTLAGRSLSLVKYLSHNKLRKHNSKYNERAIRVKKVPKHMADIDYVRDLLEFRYGYVESIYCIQRTVADGTKLPFYQKRYEDEYKSFAVTMCSPESASLAVSDSTISVFDALGKAHTIKVESYQPSKNKLQNPAQQQSAPKPRDLSHPEDWATNSIQKQNRSAPGMNSISTFEAAGPSMIPNRQSNQGPFWPEHSQRGWQFSNTETAGIESEEYPPEFKTHSATSLYGPVFSSTHQMVQGPRLLSGGPEQSAFDDIGSEYYNSVFDHIEGRPPLCFQPEVNEGNSHISQQGFAKVGAKVTKHLSTSSSGLTSQKGDLQYSKQIMANERPSGRYPEEFEGALSKPNLHRYFGQLKYRGVKLGNASNYRLNVLLECLSGGESS